MNCRHCGQKLGLLERWKLGHFCSKECRTAFAEEEARLTEQIVQELRRQGPRGAETVAEPVEPPDPAEAPFVPQPEVEPIRASARLRGVEPAPAGPRGTRGVWKELAHVVVERSTAIGLQGGESRRWARAIRIEFGLPQQAEAEDSYLNSADRPVLAPELRPRLQRPRLGLAGLGAPVNAEFRSPQWRLPELAVPLDTPQLGAAAGIEECRLLLPEPARSGLSPMAQGRFLQEHPIRLPVEPPALEATEVLACMRAEHWSLMCVQASPGWLPENIPLTGVVLLVQLIPLEPRQESALLAGGMYPAGALPAPPMVPGMGAVFPAGYTVPPYILNQIANYASPTPRQFLSPPPELTATVMPSVSAPPHAAATPVVLPAAPPSAYGSFPSVAPGVTVIPAWAQALTGVPAGAMMAAPPAGPARRGREGRLPASAPVMSWADLLPEFAPAILDWPSPSRRPAFVRNATRPLSPKNRRPIAPQRVPALLPSGWTMRRAPVELLAGLGLGATPVLAPERLLETKAAAEPVEVPRAAPRWGRRPERAGLTARRPPIRVRLHAVADADFQVPEPVRRMAG